MQPNNNTIFTIVLLDPRGTILGGGSDVIQRIQDYGYELSRCDSKLKLLVFSSHTESKDFESSFLDIICLSKPTFNALIFAIRAQKYLKRNNLKIKLLVASDPWESFWSAYLLNKLSLKKMPIQIQLHGDIANPAWKKISLQNRVRFNLAKFSMSKASGIRAVSGNQALKVAKIFKIKKAQISVIPVPINNLRLTADISSKRPKTLGLIGRIHNDRGIYNFIKIVKSLTVVRDDFAVVIAGGGPHESKFLEEIKELLPKSKIRFLGHLSEKELKKVWRGIGVLVSTAPAESYGRVMREALVAGVPVWATLSSGVEDLISKAGKDSVKILDLEKSNHELSRELDQLLKNKVSLSFRKQFIKDNSTYAQLLAKSWVDLINKQNK
jgi:glycosyltransferase involved in cell wall biosynthesis